MARVTRLQHASRVAEHYLTQVALGDGPRLPLEEGIVDDDDYDDGEEESSIVFEEDTESVRDDDDESDDVAIVIPAHSRRGRTLRRPVAPPPPPPQRRPSSSSSAPLPAPWPNEPEKRGAAQAECVVCKERGVCTVCQPCCHSCMCNLCAIAWGSQAMRCPACGKPVRRIQRIYPSS